MTRSSITKFCAPYVDVCQWPTFDMVACAKASGQKYFTLAFVVAQNGEASWGGYYPLASTNPPWYLDQITALRTLGGDVVISFGGASNQELAQAITDIPTLVAEYQKVIDIYDVQILDFDIEGTSVADPMSIDRRNKALVILKQNNPNIKIHYTLPVMPTGLDNNGLSVITSAYVNSLTLDLLNLMCMDYSSQQIDMGQAAISASSATQQQLVLVGYVNLLLGITPMIGVNDTGEIFTLQNAQAVLAFAQDSPHIAMLSLWSANRDVSELYPATIASSQASGVAQKANQFISVFNQFSSTTSQPTLVPKFSISFVVDSTGTVTNVQVLKE